MDGSDDRGMSAAPTLVRVVDGMTTGLISCAPEATLRTVAKLMAAHRVHAVYVFDYGLEDDETVELWGLVNDLDVAAGVRDDLDGLTARESAVTPLVVVQDDEPLEHAAALMTERGVSHLAVLDSVTGRPVGVISTLDIAAAAADMRF
jgi:predicted transcriptional regulator